MAPESDWMPMSYVPPSPPKAMNFTFLSAGISPVRFLALNMASAPLHVTAEFSNALWMKGFFHAVYG
jgi:hypothetical protein